MKYIELEAAVTAVNESPCWRNSDDWYEHASVIEKSLRAIPAVDAVEVVRCADCEWCQYDELYGQRWCDGRRVKPDHFCGYGKRKSDMPLGTDNSEPPVELEPITGERKVYHGELDVRNGKLTIYGSDRCVCCGEPVPEGRMVCPTCERRADND